MNRTELIIIIAAILFVAFALGWVAAWVFHRLQRATTSDIAELERMAAALHEAEEARDEALTYYQQRESELVSQLGQTEAELRAAMDGLGEARREAEELRAYIEANSN